MGLYVSVWFLMGLIGPNASIWVVVCPYVSLLVFIGHCRSKCVFMGPNRFLTRI